MSEYLFLRYRKWIGNERGQTLAVIPIILAATMGGAAYWGYHSNIIQMQAQAQKGGRLDLFNQLVEMRLRLAITRSGYATKTCTDLVDDVRTTYRDFSSVPTEPLTQSYVAASGSEVLASAGERCLFTSEESRGIKRLDITVTLLPRVDTNANAPGDPGLIADATDGVRDIQFNIVSTADGGATLVSMNRIRFRVRRLMDYSLILAEKNGAPQIQLTNSDASSVHFRVAGNTMILDDPMQTASSLITPRAPWLYFDGTVSTESLPSSFFDGATSVTTSLLSRIFVRHLRVGYPGGGQLLGDHMRPVLPTNDGAGDTEVISANDCVSIDLSQPNNMSNPWPYTDPRNDRHQQLNFTANSTSIDNQNHCGLIRAPSVKVSCPVGVCRIYGLIITRSLEISGMGVVVLTNPVYHVGLGGGPLVASRDTLWRSRASARITESLKRSSTDPASLYYEPMMEVAHDFTAKTFAPSRNDYSEVFMPNYLNSVYLDEETLP